MEIVFVNSSMQRVFSCSSAVRESTWASSSRTLALGSRGRSVRSADGSAGELAVCARICSATAFGEN